MSTFTHSITVEVIPCAQCGMSFGAPEDWLDRRRAKHDTFYCPAGHHNYFPGDTAEKKLKREQERSARLLAEADRLRADRDHTARRLSATQGVVTRTKRRIGNGVCPCCGRTFQQLARHMHAKHPEYAESGASS